MIVRIDKADGTVTALHDDDLAGALRGLGPLDVRRASTVEFDNDLQGWMIEFAEPADVAGVRVGPFPRRAEALGYERVYLEARLAGRGDAAASREAGRALRGVK